ncbi:MAG: dTMP kinase [Pseudomonadota bacterium]
MAGIFITLEGIEGCGKTTQIRKLEAFLKERNYDVVLTREPGGTKIGDQIRRILLLTENKGMFPITELLLYAAARNQHVEEVIAPALKKGKIVLCDRYADATYAYQGAARKIKMSFLEELHKIAAGGLKPQLTLVLDCPAEQGLTRARQRNDREMTKNIEDRFEQEDLDFHEKVRQGYLELAKKEPERIIIVDASQGLDVIHQDIVKQVMRVLS